MWQKNVRYLDYNASSGVTGSVRKKLKELLDRSDLFFANPSSKHRLGQQAHQMLTRATMKVASTFSSNQGSDDLVFTGSGTLANQTVIRSAAKFANLIIIGSGEHSASYDQIQEISSFVKTVELPLLSNGQYDFDALKSILNDAKQSGISKVFLSLFWANNETGVLTSVEELGRVLQNSSLEVILHLDASQVWGKLPIDLKNSPAHYVTFSGHKIGAPAGVGVIWSKVNAPKLDPVAGTENLLGIMALSFAAEEIDPQKFSERTLLLRDAFEKGVVALNAEFPQHAIRIWGKESPRISNTSRLSFGGFSKRENWVELCDLRGFAVSHGSACESDLVKPSRVLLKMGASHDEAMNAIRVSFGADHTLEDVSDFVMALRGILSEKSTRS